VPWERLPIPRRERDESPDWRVQPRPARPSSFRFGSPVLRSYSLRESLATHFPTAIPVSEPENVSSICRRVRWVSFRVVGSL
jgi:hypothetical protein